MSDIAIRAENLSKLYRVGERKAGYKTIRESLTNALSAPLRRLRGDPRSAIRDPRSDAIWALNDVSFEVKQGEVIGIIGRNGAGKSTLLKILSRVTKPTQGRAEIRGRVGSLLEVGTGFHPELTGRENIYLNGAILGMRKAELDRKFDEIIAFAEVEKFIDTPVKHYSSGMYVRLGFAVAAHLEPAVLLVDEVLAVGDARFWSKSISKIRDLNARGMTVMLVTHNMWLVQTVCSRAICLERGAILASGGPLQVIGTYRDRVMTSLDEADGRKAVPRQSEAGRILQFQVHREGNWATEREAYPDSGIRVLMTAESGRYSRVKLLIRVTSPDGLPYFTVYSDLIDAPEGEPIESEVAIPRLMLMPGEYLLWGAVCSPEGEDNILAQERLPFSVKDTGNAAHRFGLFWNQAHWRVEVPSRRRP
jgi:ABC-type polysaccharide/polyol phosphate transport system ATPase subunit